MPVRWALARGTAEQDDERSSQTENTTTANQNAIGRSIAKARREDEHLGRDHLGDDLPDRHVAEPFREDVVLVVEKSPASTRYAAVKQPSEPLYESIPRS